MARPASGTVLEKTTKRGRVFALRFRAYGERRYVTLAVTSRQEAELELQNVLADVRRGTWRPPAEDVVDVGLTTSEEPSFHVFASEWVERRRHEVDTRSVDHWKWALELHLLPHFQPLRPSHITGRQVEAFKVAKLREREEIDKAHAQKQRLGERGLSAGSINKCLTVLAQILDDAIEDGYLSENPARGKRRMLKTSKPRRTWLELHEAKALIEAATPHRALIATMVLLGLRVGELTQLKWRDVNLAAGTLKVEDAKTDGGQRVIDLSPWLGRLATPKRGRGSSSPATSSLYPQTEPRGSGRNISREILHRSIDDANAALVKAGGAPIQAHVTNHSLRRTFASLLYEAGASRRT